jgi:predicted nucleic acid-binding protein
MKYLLDTNILSETVRVQPHLGVKKWLQEQPPETLFISVLTLGEIRRGVEKLGDSKRRTSLVAWLEHDLLKWFGSNVLTVDLEVAERWGYITATANHNSLHAIDTLLAATALTHNLKMVTRNVKDFQVPGLEVINPFE